MNSEASLSNTSARYRDCRGSQRIGLISDSRVPSPLCVPDAGGDPGEAEQAATLEMEFSRSRKSVLIRPRNMRLGLETLRSTSELPQLEI